MSIFANPVIVREITRYLPQNNWPAFSTINRYFYREVLQVAREQYASFFSLIEKALYTESAPLLLSEAKEEILRAKNFIMLRSACQRTEKSLIHRLAKITQGTLTAKGLSTLQDLTGQIRLSPFFSTLLSQRILLIAEIYRKVEIYRALHPIPQIGNPHDLVVPMIATLIKLRFTSYAQDLAHIHFSTDPHLHDIKIHEATSCLLQEIKQNSPILQQDPQILERISSLFLATGFSQQKLPIISHELIPLYLLRSKERKARGEREAARWDICFLETLWQDFFPLEHRQSARTAILPVVIRGYMQIAEKEKARSYLQKISPDEEIPPETPQEFSLRALCYIIELLKLGEIDEVLEILETHFQENSTHPKDFIISQLVSLITSHHYHENWIFHACRINSKSSDVHVKAINLEMIIKKTLPFIDQFFANQQLMANQQQVQALTLLLEHLSTLLEQLPLQYSTTSGVLISSYLPLASRFAQIDADANFNPFQKIIDIFHYVQPRPYNCIQDQDTEMIYSHAKNALTVLIKKYGEPSVTFMYSHQLPSHIFSIILAQLREENLFFLPN